MGDLKHIEGRVIVSADMDRKNWYTFADGTRIRYERDWDNLNVRHTKPVNAIVISGENINEGAEILVHPNALVESNEIFNYQPLSGEKIAENVKHFSIPEDMCYAWLDGQEWRPLKNFAFGLRVYKQYSGIIQGIEPTLIKDVLFVTTGELEGNVVHVLKSSDYEIIFQDTNDREGRIIRFRHFEDEELNEREEVIVIDHGLTEKVEDGTLLIGISPTTAKKIHESELVYNHRIY